MKIDISALPEGHSSVQETMVEFDPETEWPRFADGLKCQCEIACLPLELTISVSFSGRVLLQCSRCLDGYEVLVTGTCHVLARASEDDEPIGFTDDDTLEYVYDSDAQSVDLGQLLYDEVMTALPMRPLCRSDCNGVEVEETPEEPDRSDPRWEALRKLKERNS
jgi:uncharacterized metal-binding protein YceD (DUF177 family)